MALLSDGEVQESLKTLEGWQLIDRRIGKPFVCASFREAIFFVNCIAAIAEQANHHPDILVNAYKKVTLTLVTHSAKGLTEKDIDFARQVENFWAIFNR